MPVATLKSREALVRPTLMFWAEIVASSVAETLPSRIQEPAPLGEPSLVRLPPLRVTLPR